MRAFILPVVAVVGLSSQVQARDYWPYYVDTWGDDLLIVVKYPVSDDLLLIVPKAHKKRWDHRVSGETVCLPMGWEEWKRFPGVQRGSTSPRKDRRDAESWIEDRGRYFVSPKKIDPIKIEIEHRGTLPSP